MIQCCCSLYGACCCLHSKVLLSLALSSVSVDSNMLWLLAMVSYGGRRWYIFYGRSALVCCCRCNCSTRLSCFCSCSNVVAFAHNEVVLLPKPNRDLYLYKGIQLCLFYTNVWLFWVIWECLGIYIFIWEVLCNLPGDWDLRCSLLLTKARDVISSRRMTGRLTREDRRQPITQPRSV